MLSAAIRCCSRAAEDAVRQWRYRPTLLNGQPVETQTQVLVNFVGDSHPTPQPAAGPEPAADAVHPPVLVYRQDPKRRPWPERYGREPPSTKRDG